MSRRTLSSTRLAAAGLLLLLACPSLDFTPPTVEILAPEHWATVHDSMLVVVRAADANLARVQLYVDDELDHEETRDSFGYVCHLSKPGATNLKALAVDKRGNWSAPHEITVINEASGIDSFPAIPSRPQGAARTRQFVLETYTTSAADPRGDSVRYVFDWGDATRDTTAFVPSGQSQGMTHTWDEAGTYNVKALAVNRHRLAARAWSDPLPVTVAANLPPEAPETLGGPRRATCRDRIALTTRAVDPDGDSVYIKFYYNTRDTTQASNWLGPVASGEYVTDHVQYWQDGDYTLYARAKDMQGAVSEASPRKYLTICVAVIAWSLYSNSSTNFNYSPALAVQGNALVIYVPTDGDSILAIRDNGTSSPTVTQGTFSTGPAMAVEAPVLSPDNRRLYIAADDGRIYVFDAATMRDVCYYPSTLAPWTFTMPAVDGDRLYLGRGDTLYCLTDQGTSLVCNWVRDVRGEMNFPPVIAADGATIFAVNDSGLFAFDPDGRRIWDTILSTVPTAAPALAADGKLILGGNNGRLYVLDPAHGHVVFNSDSAPAPIVGSPVIGADGTIYAVRQDGYAFAWRGGSNVWTYDVGGTFSAAPCLAPDSTLIVHSDEDALTAVRVLDGRLDWEINLAEPGARRRRCASYISSSPTIGPNLYRVYVGGASDAFFYAVTVARSSFAQGLPAAPWPKLQHDLRNSGTPSGR